MTRVRVDAMAVVVPVRDEAGLLARCLGALGEAVDEASVAGIRCEVRVVLDACTDASEEIARAHPFPVLVSDDGRVGAARARGAADALRALTGTTPDRIWVANTDADSRVPSHWLTHQAAISAFADVCAGTVRPDFDDLTHAQRALWLRTHVRGRPNGNIHGANLGIRADAYLEAGGFAPIAEHEDVDLIARCRSLGAVVAASDEAEVVTSGRLIGRTPGGYAGFLRVQAAELARNASMDR